MKELSNAPRFFLQAPRIVSRIDNNLACCYKKPIYREGKATAMSNETAYTYVDTNTFLHYKMFTEIDWCKELETESATLVVCTAVLGELDKKKFSDSDARIRERAKKIISKLSQFENGTGQVQLHPGVSLLFVTREPSIDWNKEGLSPDITDDRLIATILSEESTRGNVVLVTADLGFRLKAKARAIRCHTLPDPLRLAEKKSPEEEENIKLRERLSRIENSLPVLSIKLPWEEGLQGFKRFSLNRMPPLSPSNIEAELSHMRETLKYIPPSSPNANIPFWAPFLGVSQADVDRYNKEVDEYIKQMSDYFKKEWEYKEWLSRTIKLEFILVNDGNSPAEDIDIFLHFPDGFILVREDKFPKAPHPPDEPVPPKPMGEMLANFGKMNPDLLRTLVPPSFNRYPKLDIPRGPFIKKTKSYEVKYHEPKVKHGMQIELDPVYAIFPSIESANSFNIDYSLLAANVPEEVTGQIHIIIDKQNN